MPTAYVLINCDLDHKDEVRMEISQLPGVLESAELDTAYDILVKLNLGTVEELQETIKGHIEKIPHILEIMYEIPRIKIESLGVS
jgi:DNA-binding Lrp family transcriptional regulator